MKKATGVEQLLQARARHSLAVYLGLVHMTDDQRQAIPPKHLLEQVIPAIQDDTLGHTVIIAPPGSIKTNTLIGACAWWLGQDPTQHVAYICNTGPKALERSLVIRDLVERYGPYKNVFPEVKPDKSRGWAQDAWYLQRQNLTDKNPSLLAVGVGGAVLGARIHRAILDDLADDENMKTELQRRQLKTWLEQTFLTRMDDPIRKRAVMACTRWHQDDPAQWAIDQGWHVIHIPGLNEEGESYWPERWPKERLACEGEHGVPKCYFNGVSWDNCMKRQLGADGFAKQFMGVVTDEETAIFKRHNWRWYRDVPKECNRGAIFVDLAHEEKTTADYTVICAVTTDGHRRYWEAMTRRRMQFPEVLRAVKDMRVRYDYPLVIEDTPGSKPLIQQLQRELWGVIPWKIEGRSKLARMEAAAPSHEAGDWFLPEGAGWAQDVVEEHAQAPFGKHDDTVDVSTMMHAYFSKRARGARKTKVGLPFRRDWSRMSA